MSLIPKLKAPLAPLPAPHVVSKHAYPACQGVRTTLGVFGWRCTACTPQHTLPFRTDAGLTWQEMRVPATDFTPEKEPQL